MPTTGGLRVSIPGFGISKPIYGRSETQAIEDYLLEPYEIPCKYCGNWTPMLGTQLCNPCWEVARHLDGDLSLIYRIILDKSELFHRFRSGLQANDPNRLLILHMAFAAGYNVQCLHQDGSWRETMIIPGLWYRINGRSSP